MEKMSKEERVKLLRALTAASNAFHDVLREHGYTVSYGGSDCYQTGSISKLDTKPYETDYIGDLSITWHIKT